MDNNETIRAYNEYARYYRKTHDPYFYKEELAEFRNLVKGKKVIDIGCGAGRNATFFVENGFDYLGIDASEEMLKIARQEVPGGKFLLMDFCDLNLPPKSFDGFWSSDTLLHAPKREISPILQLIRRIIKPLGIGFITVQEKEHRTGKYRGVLEEGIISHVKDGQLIKRYISFYSEEEFKKILEDNSFKVISSHQKKEKEGIIWLCYFVSIT